MTPRVCICCGEPITEHGNALSRNPNLCASCSSLADGMEECSISTLRVAEPEAPQQETGLPERQRVG